MYSIDYDKMKPAERVAKEANRHSNVGCAIPDTIAMNMVELIDSSWFIPKPSELNGNKLLLDEYANNHRVLDICCNSGILLYWFLQRFRTYLERYAKTSFNNSEDELCEYIIKNLLYGVSINLTICQIIRSMLYNNRDVYGNIYNYDVLNATHHADSDEFEIRGSDVYIYDRSKGEKVPMKFDVVCGNPPYNDDIYLDFVMLGHRLAKTYDLWITPDGWRTKDRGKNAVFRQTLFSSIYKLNLQSSKDIFPEIAEINIDYYLLDKLTHNDKIVNGIPLKNVEPMQSFDAKVYAITDKVRYSKGFSSVLDNIRLRPERFLRVTIPDFQHLKDSDIDEMSRYVLSDSKQSIKISSDAVKPTARPDCYSLCSGAWINPNIFCTIKEPYNLETGTSITLYLGTKSECESAKTYYESRFIWFLVYGIFGKNAQHTRYYKFVPDPGSFDKVYEDRPLEGYTPDKSGVYTDNNGVVHCSLYTKYKLTDEEINIIESTIRERK